MSNLSPLALALSQAYGTPDPGVDWERVAEMARPVWQPIETAPMDGTTVFGYAYGMGHRGMVSFNGREWEMVDGLTNLPMGIGFYPSHWQPLPDAPA